MPCKQQRVVPSGIRESTVLLLYLSYSTDGWSVVAGGDAVLCSLILFLLHAANRRPRPADHRMQDAGDSKIRWTDESNINRSLYV